MGAAVANGLIYVPGGAGGGGPLGTPVATHEVYERLSLIFVSSEKDPDSGSFLFVPNVHWMMPGFGQNQPLMA